AQLQGHEQKNASEQASGRAQLQGHEQKNAAVRENSRGNVRDGGHHVASTEQEMVRIPGGKFLMGTNVGDGFPDDGEAPIHNVRVRPFNMASHTVTNAQFADFIRETGYVTDAEKFGWSFVFHLFVSEETAARVTQKVR